MRTRQPVGSIARPGGAPEADKEPAAGQAGGSRRLGQVGCLLRVRARMQPRVEARNRINGDILVY